jgi:oxygen-independent coproporphyrinogen-3 oxidase
MCDSELALLGRSHQASEAQEALRLARSAGFENLNADLLIGIPGQTLASLAETLDRVVDQVRHLSLYLLSVEPGTVLEGMVNSGQVEIPSEEQVISLWEWASARLVESGLKRYEISNWSQPGYESVHNMVYWQRGEYAGIGAGAHSHREGRRYSKIGSIPEYLAAVNGGLDPLGMHEVLTGQQMFLEELMLGLRMVAGVDLARLVERFDVDREGLQQCLDVLAERGLVIRNSNYLLLSPTGLALHDAVSEAIAYAAHAL